MIKNFPNIEDSAGFISSIFPCTGYITFGPWIYMCPQYKPKSVLLLGYAGGTVAGLIRLFYGQDVEITGVDIDDCEDFGYGVELIKADAREYIKTCRKFDAVVVDVFSDGHTHPCKFITSKEFADDLKKISNYIILHMTAGMSIENYQDLHHVKTLLLNRSRFHYFMVNDIPTLPIR